MQYEHQLTEAEAAFFQTTRENDLRIQEEYFAALGRAKDAEMRAEANAAQRQQQLQIIVKNAHLPAGKIKISADGLSLIVEAMAAIAPTNAPLAPANHGQAALNQ